MAGTKTSTLPPILLLTLALCGVPSTRGADQQAIENAIMSQAQEITQLKAQMTDLQNSCSQSFDYLKENVQKERLRPAFHADFNKTTQTNVGDKEVLKFDNVMVNYGDGYHKDTGKFTAPITGLYSLSVHYEEAQGQYVYVNLMTDPQGKVSFSAAGDPEWQNSASFTAVVFLQKGESAWVERETGTASYVLNGHRSSFSGFMIRAD